jgi:hypothetical protein
MSSVLPPICKGGAGARTRTEILFFGSPEKRNSISSSSWTSHAAFIPLALRGLRTSRWSASTREGLSSPLLDLDHQVEDAPHFSDWRCHDSLSWVEMMMEGGEKEKKN